MGVRRIAIGASVVVLVAGGAVVVDRVAVGAAQTAAVRELKADFHDVAGSPNVTIGGFPFLTQLLAGRLTDVGAHLDAVTFGGVEVANVDIKAQGVTTGKPYVVHRAVVSATLSVESLQRLIATRSNLDVKVGLDGDRIVATAEVLGLPATAVLVPRAGNGGIRVDIADVTLGGISVAVGALPHGLAAGLTDLTIPIDGLPAGVVLTGVVVRDGGVRITAAGTDVVLPAALTSPTP